MGASKKAHSASTLRQPRELYPEAASSPGSRSSSCPSLKPSMELATGGYTVESITRKLEQARAPSEERIIRLGSRRVFEQVRGQVHIPILNRVRPWVREQVLGQLSEQIEQIK